MPDQYVFCHLALIEYAYQKKLIPSLPDLTSFETSQSDDSDWYLFWWLKSPVNFYISFFFFFFFFQLFKNWTRDIDVEFRISWEIVPKVALSVVGFEKIFRSMRSSQVVARLWRTNLLPLFFFSLRVLPFWYLPQGLLCILTFLSRSFEYRVCIFFNCFLRYLAYYTKGDGGFERLGWADIMKMDNRGATKNSDKWKGFKIKKSGHEWKKNL